MGGKCMNLLVQQEIKIRFFLEIFFYLKNKRAKRPSYPILLAYKRTKFLRKMLVFVH